MKAELYNYDLYPKVVLAGSENIFTIKPLGIHAGLIAGESYTVVISGVEDGDPEFYPEWAVFHRITLQAQEDHCLRFPFVFPREEEYFVSVFRGSTEETLLVRMSVYALSEDMRGRYPFRGDLHVHTCRSDGKEAPAIVCANYRAAGYDFMIISDHRRYYPSLEAISALTGVAPSFCIYPGEEVQLPTTDIHIINAGGKFSINALVAGSKNEQERGDDPAFRSLDGECPDVLSREEFEGQIKELAKVGWFDAESANLSYATCLWAFERIREAGGMSIFCHPYWRKKWGYHVPEKYLKLMIEQHRFDAFEVLGGESYYEQNGFQTALYYEKTGNGIALPIVGSTDTHGSTEHDPNGLICSTIVFAPENTISSLNASVMSYYSVAVDTISKEFRLVGSLRLQKYACFLMNWYYPLHDRLCAIEGEYLRQYVVGEEKAKARLDLIANDVSDLMKKYISVE